MTIEVIELLYDIKADNEFRNEMIKKDPRLMKELMRLHFPFNSCPVSSSISVTSWLEVISIDYVRSIMA